MSLRYRTVLLDLDGTLIDSSRDLVVSVRYALGQVQDRKPPPDDVIIMEVGKPLEVMLRDFGYPHGPEETARFVTTYRAHFAKHFGKHTRIYPRVEETLNIIREAGARLALVTTKHQVQAELAVDKLGLRTHFDHIQGWKDGLKPKPDPEPVRLALEKLGSRAEDSLMVGDTEQDVLSARAAGVATCAVTYGFRPVFLLRTLRPDYMIRQMVDLAHIVVSTGRCR